MEHRIRLGQEVKDNISGFRGIAVCRCTWLHGCERIVVQPPIPKGTKDGKLPVPGVLTSHSWRSWAMGSWWEKRSLPMVIIPIRRLSTSRGVCPN